MAAVVRAAVDGDLDAVARIYAREVAEGHATFDVAPPARSVWEAKLASTHPGDHFLVAEAEPGGPVVGFAYSGAFRDRGAYHHTREVTVYLGAGATGRGLGRLLYDDLLARMTAAGMRTALACIALPNDASEGLHRACGFERQGVLREVGRKHGRWIDIVWWQKMLLPEA
ncbi:N-acetyltransferase family protein [Nocardioides sp. WV_118_6]|uniref:GNAT family N-acetyltransferase n=1 Tax=Nocardioides simplex TaxID=2045 RepID=UPI00214FC139|nr:GNAT family N-acetyltransferase [Pimelobacter simplex]UUW90194.1 N-acetyltransferase family protein [Pimelobacter simplex]UUW94023.1 N-acetyltransferase family protein [Pimelobacter simplex]